MTLDGELLTTQEVASKLKMDEKTVRGYINKGDLPAVRVGNRFRVDPVDLLAFLERNTTSAVLAFSEARLNSVQIRPIPAN